MYKLHNYQSEVKDFALSQFFIEGSKGVGLLMDPGLGKTLITLSLIDDLRSMNAVKRVLVIAPLRVCRLVWPAENAKFGFNYPLTVLCGSVKRNLANSDAFIEVINAESLHHLVEHAGRWDLIVVDESSKFKTWTTKRMKCLRKILPFTERRLILTGSPAANSLADFHSQMYILDDGERLGKNVTVFRSEYMYKGGWQGRVFNIRPDKVEKLKAKVREVSVYLDAETHLDMPELIDTVVPVEMPPEAYRKYRVLKQQLLAQLESGDLLLTNSASAYIKCRQFANGAVYDDQRVAQETHTAKLDAVSDLVDELYGKPLLLFYQFQSDCARLQNLFPKAGVLNGGTKPKDAEALVHKWNNDELSVFLIQNQAASHGLNLQGGSCADVGYFGLGDSREVFEQSFRRVYRQGVQSRSVRVHRFLAEGTVDYVIHDRLNQKGQTQAEFLEALKAHARS